MRIKYLPILLILAMSLFSSCGRTIDNFDNEGDEEEIAEESDNSDEESDDSDDKGSDHKEKSAAAADEEESTGPENSPDSDNETDTVSEASASDNHGEAAPATENSAGVTPAQPATVEPTATLSPDNDYILPNSSTEILTYDDIAKLTVEMIPYARNEIYARHGYAFQKDVYRDYFGAKAWYSVNPNFKESDLSEIEKANVDFLKSYEQGNK